MIVKLKENLRKKTIEKMAKRAADSIVAIQDLKRSRNELVGVTMRDKALLESVRDTINCSQISQKKCFFLLIQNVCL